MSQPPEGPSPVAVAVQWVSRITTVALVMVLPGIAGQWLDQRWGTKFLTPLGFVFGLTAGFYYLLAMTGVIKHRRSRGDRKDNQR
ncbi:MAG: AtpZ/AtpI family protein [Planctomycetota bacterium]|nr:AtpZ/AtpI family protein [Planctomycetota bacterium]